MCGENCMSKLKLAFIYPWATYGGVERILISRAKFFSDNTNYIVDLVFTHDTGAADSIKNAVSACKNINVLVESLDILRYKSYDYVFCIDFPEAITFCDKHKIKYFAECHTSYKENRSYLRKLAPSCLAIICPSDLFIEEIKRETNHLSVPVKLLRNFVYENDNAFEYCCDKRIFDKKPILFLGRMDHLKNIIELLNAFCIIKKDSDEFFLLLCGAVSPDVDINFEINKRKIRGDVVILPPIAFDKVPLLFKYLLSNKGIFVSPSTAESFGLAVSEAIYYEVPTVLSDIRAHKNLVNGFHEEMLYSINDPNDLARKIKEIDNNYDSVSEKIIGLKKNFSPESFASDWNNLLIR